MKKYLISIITVCYNSEKTIWDTIKSVLSQDYDNFEYIIVDGKSKDKTLDIINNFNDSRIRVISEKDNGIYDAMNKGIKLATGDIIATINSDDVLDNNKIFSSIINNFNEDDEIIYGDIKYYNEDFTKVIRDYVSGENTSLSWCPAHPSMYVRKEVFDKVGVYDTQFKICADYDFMIRCNVNNIKYKYLKQYVVKMRYGGTSNGVKGYIENFNESVKVLKKNKVKHGLLITIKRSFKTLLSIK